MTTTNFMIGPIKEGLNKNIKPFASPEDSFETMLNAYQFRGRVVRRQGYTLLGNLDNHTPVMGLRTQEGFTIGEQNLIAFDTTLSYKYNGTNFVPLSFFRGDGTSSNALWTGTDYQFFWSTNYANAFWATNSKPGLHGYALSNVGPDAFTATNGLTGTAAEVNVNAPGNNFVVGDFIYFLNVTGAAAANNLMYGKVITAGNPFRVQSLDPNGTAFVNGQTTSGIVLSSTAQKVGQDGIRYYADNLGYITPTTHNSWANYNPPVDPNNALIGALLIFPYRGYLVFLNTTEGNEQNPYNYPNRARWTEIGTPYYSLPTPSAPNPMGYDPKAVRDDLFGRGGANDAPTNESIVAAGFIRDILVVYFTRSTWRLRFVNNSQNPFVWERVNVELGSDCTFSSIAFDKGLMAIGNRGIVISDANDTIRFDEKIPDDIFDIRQNEHGLFRVNGIRSFRTRLNFWTFPDGAHEDGIYPDKVLVFNYETKNWSYFDDCFTCFGYFYSADPAVTWADLTDPWPSYNTMTASDGITQQGFETIVAGNQQGFVFKLEQTTPKNSASLFVESITLSALGPPPTPTLIHSTNHNLPEGSWITLTGITGTTGIDGVSLNNRNFKIANPEDADDTFRLTEFESVQGPNASGSTYNYTIDFVPILAGSVQINVGALQFVDTDLDGILDGSDAISSGTINYSTGAIVLNFGAPIVSTPVYVRVVSFDPEQTIVEVDTIGAYIGGGLIAKISGYDLTSKVFNFFGDDQRARLSKIDFYVDKTAHGQFTTDIFADSDDVPVNRPLKDNLQSNVVLTSTSPYQVGSGTETLFRLYADASAQTVQCHFYLSDAQMATNSCNGEDIQILAMMFSMRRGGRLI